MDIGNRLRKIRKEKGLTQKTLAEKLNVSTITIQNYENGRRKPNLEMLNKISKLLEVDISKFLKEDKKTTLLNKKTGELVVLDTPNIELEKCKSKLQLTEITTEVITELEDSIHEYLAVISPVEKNGFNSEKIDELVSKVNELIQFEIYKEIQNKKSE